MMIAADPARVTVTSVAVLRASHCTGTVTVPVTRTMVAAGSHTLARCDRDGLLPTVTRTPSPATRSQTVPTVIAPHRDGPGPPCRILARRWLRCRNEVYTSLVRAVAIMIQVIPSISSLFGRNNY